MNKEAWEEAFNNRINGWGDAVVENLQASSAYYIQPALQAELDQLNLAGKHVAQFCCSNGRELLSICRHYGAVGTGFDIAENLIAQGQMHAKQLHVPCSFYYEYSGYRKRISSEIRCDPVYDRCNYLVSGCKRTFSGGVRLSKAKGHYAAS